MNTDVLVIGSGFGGSVAAARAAQAGLRVTVLERGGPLDAAHWTALAEGRTGLHVGRFDNGPLNVHVLRGLGALTGNAAGGGSRIYTCVTIRPRPEIFERDWPGGLNALSLTPCYDRVAAEIRPTPCPAALSRFRRMERLGQSLGVPVTRLPLAIDWDRMPSSRETSHADQSTTAELTGWFRGVGGMKRSLELTYLQAARLSGAAIQMRTVVDVIEPVAGGYRVHFQRTVDGGMVAESMTARRVVLAAGTLNTVRMLFDNRDAHRTLPNVSGRLGERFFTNGDRGGLLFGVDHDWKNDHAPPALGWFDFWEAHRFFIMDLGLAPMVRGALANVLKCMSHRSAQSGARDRSKPVSGQSESAWMFGVMGWDDAPRRLVHAGRGRLNCIVGQSLRHTLKDNAASYMQALAGAAGARWIMVPSFIERRMPMTVHPLGGATLADSPALGVTDSHGEVFGHPGLYVADGSLLPTPTGVPPSMTIAALAERVAARVVEAAR